MKEAKAKQQSKTKVRHTKTKSLLEPYNLKIEYSKSYNFRPDMFKDIEDLHGILANYSMGLGVLHSSNQTM